MKMSGSVACSFPVEVVDCGETVFTEVATIPAGVKRIDVCVYGGDWRPGVNAEVALHVLPVRRVKWFFFAVDWVRRLFGFHPIAVRMAKIEACTEGLDKNRCFVGIFFDKKTEEEMKVFGSLKNVVGHPIVSIGGVVSG